MANPITCLLEGNGSLAGRDRAGAFTATGSGALRYAPAPNARVNYCPNPSFETGVSGWYSGPGALTQQSGGLYGSYCGRTPALSNGQSVTFQYYSPLSAPPPFTSGATYRVSFDVRAVGASRTVRPRMISFDARVNDAGLIGYTNGSNVTLQADTWTRLTMTASSTAPTFHCFGLAMQVMDASSAVQYDIDGAVIGADTGSDLGYFANAVWLDPITGVLGTAHASPSVSRATFWIEEATTNLVTNPWRSVDNSGYSAVNGSTARSTSYAYQGPGAGLLTASAANAEEIISITAAASSHTAQAIVRNLNASSRTCQLYYNGSAIGSSSSVATGETKTITAAFTGTGGAANLSIRWTDSANTETFAHYYLGAEAKAYATSPCPAVDKSGTIQSGYTWSGTAHASTSTRTESTSSAATANRIGISNGSVVFRYLRSVDTSGEEIYGEVGTKSGGTDHVRWGIDSSDRAFVEWSSNNAAYQRVTRTGALSIDTKYIWYIDWSGTAANIAIGTESLTGGTRDAASGSWGAGNIVLEGAPSGNKVGPVLIYDRPLTAAERAKVNAAIDSNGAASLWTVLGSNAYRNFQLRPVSQ